MSRRLVALHGGKIEAASPGPGLGSEFSLRVPPACICASEPGLPGDRAAATEVQGAGIRLLIADDNVDAAESLAELLRLDGHDVRVAHDGREALRVFEEFDPAAAMLDVGMPHLSGLEVARAIRLRPSGRRALLIAITGWGQDRDRREVMEAGFDHHATKPVDPASLQAMIAAVSRGRVETTAAP